MAPGNRRILSTSQESESDSERSQTREERRRVAPPRPRPSAPTASGTPLEGVTPDQMRAIRAILADPSIGVDSTPAAAAMPAAPPITGGAGAGQAAPTGPGEQEAATTGTGTAPADTQAPPQARNNFTGRGRGWEGPSTQPFGRGTSRRGNGRGMRWYYFGMYCPYPGQYSAYCTVHRERGCIMCMYFVPEQ